MHPDEPESPWRGQSVIVYDRCVSPDHPALDERLEQCLEYAAGQECRVLATYVDYGISATIDGRQVAGWVDIRRRPVLNHAVGRANAPGIWLLLWHPDRLSAFAGCRAPIIKCLDGRVLRVGRGLVEPARFEMLEAPSSGLGMAS